MNQSGEESGAVGAASSHHSSVMCIICVPKPRAGLQQWLWAVTAAALVLIHLPVLIQLMEPICMSIFLIRHGETPLNATRTIQFPHTPLSERGQAQASAVAERLSTAALGAILTSDYQRAYSTAEAIKQLNGAPLSVLESLRERDFGDLRGKSFAELGIDPFAPGFAPPAGETEAMFNARVAVAWDEVLMHASQVEGDLAVVTHGLVLRSLAQHVLTLAEHVDYAAAGFANTCLTQAEGPPWQIELLACDLHLSAELKVAGGKA